MACVTYKTEDTKPHFVVGFIVLKLLTDATAGIVVIYTVVVHVHRVIVRIPVHVRHAAINRTGHLSVYIHLLHRLSCCQDLCVILVVMSTVLHHYVYEVSMQKYIQAVSVCGKSPYTFFCALTLQPCV